MENINIQCDKLREVEFDLRQDGAQAFIIFNALMFIFSNKEKFIKEAGNCFCSGCWDEFHDLLDQYADHVEHARLHGVD